jgi:hypothetical protein
MKNYYRIRQNPDEEYTITTDLDIPDGSDGESSYLLHGKKLLAPFPNPCVLDLDGLDAKDGENPRHFIKGAGIVVISDLFLKALRTAGVDNFEIFPVVLKCVKSKRTWKNYYALNEIGLLDAVSLDDSKYAILASDSATPLLSFHKVVLSAKNLKQNR